MFRHICTLNKWTWAHYMGSMCVELARYYFFASTLIRSKSQENNKGKFMRIIYNHRWYSWLVVIKYRKSHLETDSMDVISVSSISFHMYQFWWCLLTLWTYFLSLCPRKCKSIVYFNHYTSLWMHCTIHWSIGYIHWL